MDATMTSTIGGDAEATKDRRMGKQFNYQGGPEIGPVWCNGHRNYNLRLNNQYTPHQRFLTWAVGLKGA